MQIIIEYGIYGFYKIEFAMAFPIRSRALFFTTLLGVSSFLVQDSNADRFGHQPGQSFQIPPSSHRFPTAVPVANPYVEPEHVSLTTAPVLRAPAPQISKPEPVFFRRSLFSKPDYTLPFSEYKFRRSESTKRGFFDNGKPTQAELELVSIIRARAEVLSRFKLTYKFGGDHPSEGGMDCSGTMKYLLSEIGFSDMPRTSYQQYDWLRKSRTMNHAKSIPDHMGGRKGIKPGDLIFWGGTYNSGHKVSHVMVYLGQGGDGQHWMFGARGKKKKGLNGAGVDIFKLESGYQKSLVGFGSLPGVS